MYILSSILNPGVKWFFLCQKCGVTCTVGNIPFLTVFERFTGFFREKISLSQEVFERKCPFWPDSAAKPVLGTVWWLNWFLKWSYHQPPDRWPRLGAPYHHKVTASEGFAQCRSIGSERIHSFSSHFSAHCHCQQTARATAEGLRKLSVRARARVKPANKLLRRQDARV